MFYLHLLFDEGPRVVRLRFGEGEPPDDPTRGWVDVTDRFWRNKGLKAICLLAIIAKRTALTQGQTACATAELLRGGKGSAAATLHGLKSGQWTVVLFSNRQGSFYSPNSYGEGGKRRQRFGIILNRTLPTDKIRVGAWRAGQPVWQETDEELANYETGLLTFFATRNDLDGASETAGAQFLDHETKIITLNRQLSVAVLLGSENLDYTNNIYAAFYSRLKRAGEQSMEPIVEDLVRLPNDAADTIKADARARTFLKHPRAQNADYWIAIGSPACVALRRAYGSPEKLRPAKPLLALGVSNPGYLGLPTHAPHQQCVAVFRYGSGLAAYIALMDETIFHDVPDARRRFAFVWNKKVEHDNGVAREVDQLPIARGQCPRLQLIPFDGYPTADQLKELCGDRIVWGWFTLEVLAKDAPAGLFDLMLVSTIRMHAHHGESAVAIQPDDRDIGTGGANFLLKDFTTGGTPGHSFYNQPVTDFPDYFWLNYTTLQRWEQRLGFRMSDNVERHPFWKESYGSRAETAPT